MSEQYFNDEHWRDMLSDFDRLESIVHSARNYVLPSDDLRPKSLEAARDASHKRRSGRRIGSLALVVVAFAVTGLPAFFLSAYPGLAVVSGSELQRRAAQSVAECGTETNWALYEAYSDLRSEHSARLNPSD